jgi:hypothetical protein
MSTPFILQSKFREGTLVYEALQLQALTKVLGLNNLVMATCIYVNRFQFNIRIMQHGLKFYTAHNSLKGDNISNGRMLQTE